MSGPDLSVSMGELLGHGKFLRSLARSLVRDWAEADDVVQQAWLAAIKSPPKSGSNLRGWLAKITRNEAHRLRGKEAGLERKHAQAAESGSVGSAAEFIERESQRREIVDAVLALEPIYREAILLRYFEELPPRQIAVKLDLPVATVYTHLKRALEKLRTKLEKNHGDDRRTWVLSLIPLAAPTGKGMTAWGAVAVAAGLLVITGSTVFLAKPEPEIFVAANTRAVASVPKPSEKVPNTVQQVETAASGARTPVEESLLSNRALEEVQAEPWKIMARLVTEEGKPAPRYLPTPWGDEVLSTIEYFEMKISLVKKDVGGGGGGFGGGSSDGGGSGGGFVGLGASLYVPPAEILNFDPSNGTFSLKMENYDKGVNYLVSLEVFGEEIQAEEIRCGSDEELRFVVDMESILREVRFFDLRSRRKDSGEGVRISKVQVRNAFRVLWPSKAIKLAATQERCRFLARSSLGDDYVLSVEGFGAAVLRSRDSGSGSPQVHDVWFDLESVARVTLLSKEETLPEQVEMKLMDLEGLPILQEKVRRDPRGFYELRGIPAGEFQLYARYGDQDWERKGSCRVAGIPGTTIQTEIKMTLAYFLMLTIGVQQVEGQGESKHEFEVGGLNYEKALLAPTIVVTNDGGTAFVTTGTKTNPCRKQPGAKSALLSH